MELKIFLSNKNMAHPKKNTDKNLTLLLPKHMNSQNNCNTSPFNLHCRHINGEVIGEVVNESLCFPSFMPPFKVKLLDAIFYMARPKSLSWKNEYQINVISSLSLERRITIISF